MTEYELFYLIGESKEPEMDRIKAEVKGIVEEEGGVYVGAEKVEKRKLAYIVKREVRGTYIAQRFTTPDKNDREASVDAGEESVISRINRKLNLHRDTLRFIIVRAEELPSLIEEEGATDASKVVAEVAKEAAKTVTERKTTRKPKVEVATETKDAAEAKPKKAATKAVEKEKSDEEIDKKLDEVLNI